MWFHLQKISTLQWFKTKVLYSGGPTVLTELTNPNPCFSYCSTFDMNAWHLLSFCSTWWHAEKTMQFFELCVLEQRHIENMKYSGPWGKELRIIGVDQRRLITQLNYKLRYNWKYLTKNSQEYLLLVWKPCGGIPQQTSSYNWNKRALRSVEKSTVSLSSISQLCAICCRYIT